MSPHIFIDTFGLKFHFLVLYMKRLSVDSCEARPSIRLAPCASLSRQDLNFNHILLEYLVKMNDIGKYINKLRSPQKEICKKLRKIILKALPKCEEKMWVGVPWFGEKIYIVGLKNHVNLGLCIKGLGKNELALLEGNGKTMRHVKFYTPKDIEKKKVVKLLKMVK